MVQAAVVLVLELDAMTPLWLKLILMSPIAFTIIYLIWGAIDYELLERRCRRDGVPTNRPWGCP